MLRTVNALRGPATGAPLRLAVTTGDAIDNAQWNELQTFLALLDGGPVAPGSGGPGYEGVQSLGWPDGFFWKPDGDGPDGPDFYRREFGFPHHPGLLERAMREFHADGLAVPWLACFGNHEALHQGVGRLTPGISGALTGTRKPLALPEAFDHDRALELFTDRPEAFLAGPCPHRHRRPRAAADHQEGLRRGPFPARRAPGRARVHRAEPAGRHRLLRPRHPGRPADRAGHHLPGRGRRRAASTASRPAGWPSGWPRCIRPTRGPTGAASAPATRTVWPSFSPTTGPRP